MPAFSTWWLCAPHSPVKMLKVSPGHVRDGKGAQLGMYVSKLESPNLDWDFGLWLGQCHGSSRKTLSPLS